MVFSLVGKRLYCWRQQSVPAIPTTLTKDCRIQHGKRLFGGVGRAYLVCSEAWVSDHPLQALYDGIGDVVSVISHEALNELWLPQHALGSGPVRLFLQSSCRQ